MRQRFLVAALACVLALAACASDIDDTTDTGSSSEETSAAAAGAWSFTDGPGKTVELDQAPERIIAYAGATPMVVPAKDW